MPADPNAFAEMVALTIKAALTPVLERVAGLEARLTQALALEPSVTALRDRVVAAEVKSALVPIPTEPADVDFTPVTARITSLETLVDALKDRVLVTETKAAQPAVSAGLSAAEIELLIHAAVEPVTKTMATIQERVAVVETRAPVPGPPGEKGADGKDGLNGHDGKDGAPGKDGLAGLSFEGVYQEGKSYDLGHLVTYAGSSWHCNEPTTTKPGDGSKAWTLMVKRGRDGRDGKDAETLPVVSVGSR